MSPRPRLVPVDVGHIRYGVANVRLDSCRIWRLVRQLRRRAVACQVCKHSCPARQAVLQGGQLLSRRLHHKLFLDGCWTKYNVTKYSVCTFLTVTNDVRQDQRPVNGRNACHACLHGAYTI